jgi:DNA-binding response OmpR family regulator
MLNIPAMSQHVLIAEDEPSTQRSLAFILTGRGFRVSCADNGLEALRKLRDFRSSDDGVDLLLLDIRMPEMSGIELLDELEREGTPVPTIVMTGFGDRNTLTSLVSRGCLGYLDKPFDPEQVLVAVQSAMDRQHRRAHTLHNEMTKLKAEKENLEREIQKRQRTFLDHPPCAASMSPTPAAFPAQVSGFPGMDHPEAAPRTVFLQQAMAKGGTALMAAYDETPSKDSAGVVVCTNLFMRNTAWDYSGADFLRLLSHTGVSYQPSCRLHSAAFVRFDATSHSVQIHVTSGMTVAWIPADGRRVRLYISPPVATPNPEAPVIEAMTFLAESGDRIVATACNEDDYTRFSECVGLFSLTGPEGLAAFLEHYRSMNLEELGGVMGSLFSTDFPRTVPLLMTEIQWENNRFMTGSTPYVLSQ